MRQLALDIGLAPRPTLERFFAGPNQAVLQHLRQQLQQSGPAAGAGRGPAPLPSYLWGAPGSGKTHLLQAVRQALREQGAAVAWLAPGLAEFPDGDGDWAALLIDDVQLLSPQQQARAFVCFVNAISPASGLPRWVLAAGAAPPADLPLREDLRSRLGWGHVFQLQLLGEAERRCVLRQEADARGVFLGDEVMDYVLTRFARDLGSLMQLLGQLDAFALRSRRAITIPLLKEMLGSQ